MSNPPEPENTQPTEDTAVSPEQTSADPIAAADGDEADTATPEAPEAAEAVTEVLTAEVQPSESESGVPTERRFTAPGFDAGHTEIMPSVSDAQTELIAQQSRGEKAAPQQIGVLRSRRISGTWGWVLAVIVIVLLLAAIAVLATLWLTRDARKAISQEDGVRTTIQNFDIALQNGDLAALRSLTCGDIRDRYVNYDQKAWDETYHRIAAAKQYPVVASVDEVVVNGGHAEANVTAFMAYEPRVRSTRSFDLQYRDDQWKICQSRGN